MLNKLTTIFVCTLLLLIPFAVAENFNLIYDNNGNILKDVDKNYEYDSYNQLIKVFNSDNNLLEEYTYDHSGSRIKKVEHLDNGKKTTYYPNKNLVRVVDSSGTKDTIYIYDDSGTLLSRKDPDGKMFYYHPDHLGSTTLVTSSTGATVEETSYLPFGEALEGGSDRYTYTGQEKDSTGLMYYGARYYSPFLRQFTQPDTIIQDYYNPQNLNRYSYVLNNPYKYTDPDGHFAVTVAAIIITFVVFAVVGAAVGYVAGAIADSADQTYNNYNEQQYSASNTIKIKNAIKDVDYGQVHESAKPVAYDAAIIMGTEGLATGISFNLNFNWLKGWWKGIFKKSVKSKGKDIVGSNHGSIKPMQKTIWEDIVNQKKKDILIGKDVGKIDVIDNYGYGKYIDDGHHRYVAYKSLGYSDSQIPMNVELIQDPYRVGFNDWSGTKWE
ncbi:MAG: RHS repeat-associated core domain-containing protein [Cryomorphaceae bacterium]|mgnify:FL=1|jgi:RHS repeat-associated protein|nr:RHS repeat-associated core domain-containing protein [Cryomorphaceae bacterium]